MKANETVISELENMARQIRVLAESRKRPLVIEFAGCPKSGKTTSIESLAKFLSRNEFKVAVLTERASVSPIRHKKHIYNNIWVTNASLNGMLESFYKNLDVFIMDRGLFDAICWNKFLHNTGKIDEREEDITNNFYLLPRWKESIDLVFVLTCEPEKSLEREYANLLTRKKGSIMQKTTLTQIKSAVKKTIAQYSDIFKNIEHFDTTNTTTLKGVEQIIRQTLSSLRDFLDEEILVIPKNKIELPEEEFNTDLTKFKELNTLLNSNSTFLKRSLAEDNDNYIQLIPCGIISYNNQYLLLRRKEVDIKHPLHDTYSLWAGGHVRTIDKKENDILQIGLRRELNEELFIAEKYNVTPLGLVRTLEDKRAARHLGVVYHIELSDSNVALAMDQEEFREPKGRSVSGSLMTLKDISKYRKSMRNWSKYIFDYLVHGPKLFQ